MSARIAPAPIPNSRKRLRRRDEGFDLPAVADAGVGAETGRNQRRRGRSEPTRALKIEVVGEGGD